MTERVPLDDYPTAPALAEAIVQRVAKHWSPKRIIEPSANSGNFVRACKVAWPTAQVTAVELQEKYRKPLALEGASVVVGDWVEAARGPLRTYRPELIIGNPPFALAEEHIRAGLEILDPGGQLVFLLRINFLGGQARAASFFREHPVAALYPLVPRPSFRAEGGTDSTEYGVFVWFKNWAGAPGALHAPLVWRAPKAKAA